MKGMCIFIGSYNKQDCFSLVRSCIPVAVVENEAMGSMVCADEHYGQIVCDWSIDVQCV